MTQPIKDVRKEYADLLREMADEIEQSEIQPIGIYLYLWWRTPMQHITTLNKQEPGFNLLTASGLLFNQAVEIAQMVREKKL